MINEFIHFFNQIENGGSNSCLFNLGGPSIEKKMPPLAAIYFDINDILKSKKNKLKNI